VEVRRDVHGPGRNRAAVVGWAEDEFRRRRAVGGRGGRRPQLGAPLAAGGRVRPRDPGQLPGRRVGRQRAWSHHQGAAEVVPHQQHGRDAQRAVQGQIRGAAADSLLPRPVAKVAPLLRRGQRDDRGHAVRELRRPRVEQVQRPRESARWVQPVVRTPRSQTLSQSLFLLRFCVLELFMRF